MSENLISIVWIFVAVCVAEWVATQMQHLRIVAAAKLGWDYNLTQHADTRRTGQTTYLILPDVVPGFLSDLQRGRQDKWLHATCYDTFRVVYLDEQTQMWISVQYTQQTRDLWIETQIGQPSSRIIALCQTWIGPQVKESELNEPWSTYTPVLTQCPTLSMRHSSPGVRCGHTRTAE